MTQTEAGNGGTGGSGSGGPGSGDDGLDDLRADLARVILNEAGQALVKNPDLALSSALVRAVERQAVIAARNNAERMPSAETLAEAVVNAVGPELTRIARAAGTGQIRQQMAGAGALQSRTLIGVGVAVLAGILLFIAGFVTARLLPDRPVEPAQVTTPVAPAIIVDPAGTPPASTPSTAPAAAGQPGR